MPVSGENNQPTEKAMRNEFAALEKAITKATDNLLKLVCHNEELSNKCRIRDDNFYLYHNGKVNAYELAVEELDNLRIIAKNLKDHADE